MNIQRTRTHAVESVDHWTRTIVLSFLIPSFTLLLQTFCFDLLNTDTLNLVRHTRVSQEVGDRQLQVRIIGPSSPADCFKREQLDQL